MIATTISRDGQTGERSNLSETFDIWHVLSVSLSFALQLIERHISLEGNQINFIVEDGAKGAGACPEIVKQIKKHIPELRDVPGKCFLEEKCKLPSLQGADAVSYSGYRQEREGDESELVDFHPSLDLSKEKPILKKAKQILRAKSPIFCCYGHPKVLRELKDNLVVLEERRTQKQLSQDTVSQDQSA